MPGAPAASVNGDCESSVKLEFGGDGYADWSASTCVPTIPGTTAPSANPVPAYAQCELFVTVYPVVPVSAVRSAWIPRRVCSGRFTGGARKSVVVVGPWTGSSAASRYDTSTRLGTPEALGSKRACQSAAAAPKKPRETPASRAAIAASNISFDQYSFCPTERKALWLRSSAPFACVSVSLEYVTS